MREFGVRAIFFLDVGLERLFGEGLFGEEVGLLFDRGRPVFFEGFREPEGLFVDLDGVFPVLLDVLVHEGKVR
jgi:hypothetical protein